MLSKIKVNNFKSFNNTFTFDLSETSSFAFNQECIRNNIVNKAIIYGHNGCGKSNLALAIFDIIYHVSDKKSAPERYKNYFNANSNEETTKFEFEFQFDKNVVSYVYTKRNYEELVSEKLMINNIEFCSIDRDSSYILNTVAVGTESLKKDLSNNSKISIIKYISMNTVLENTEENKVFNDFIDFINHMLLFRNLDDRFYIGLEQGRHRIEEDIIEHNNLEDFESFLNNAGIKCNLKKRDDSLDKGINFLFENREIPFLEIASSGTISLTLFYFWYQRLKEKEKCSFLFIDEFDAFYHHALARTIIERLKEIENTQVLLTTHNTSIISNDLLRPDCYFLMDEEQIRPLTKCTDRELREGHNIEKLYRANSFE